MTYPVQNEKKIIKPEELTIAIVGRTNVGKSTLFNRLLERPKAIVSSIAGTTRDRNYGRANWRGKELTLVDTGGLEDTEPIGRAIKKQVDVALEKAALVFFLVDMKDGVMPQDITIAKFLKKLGKKTILVGNKADSPTRRAEAENKEWLKLTFGKPLAVSAANGAGTGDLLDRAFELLNIKSSDGEEKLSYDVPPIKVAIVGKPNVGKSSLLNAMLGEERVLVSEIPFTTREPQDTFLIYQSQPFRLIDTVGMRKKAKVERGLEKIGVRRSIAAVEKADVVLFITEAQKQMTVQDKHLAQLIIEKNSSIIIVANKWDLVDAKGPATPNLFMDYYRKFFPSLGWAPIVFISAKTGEKVKKVFDTIITVKNEREKFLSQDNLNNFLHQTLAKHWAVIHRRKKPGAGARPFIKKIEQMGTCPPKFMITTTSKQRLPEAFVKFIEKRLRENFGFSGTPIKIEVKHIKKSKEG